MAVEDPDELDRVDRAIRINELKEEARELAGGEMHAFESDDLPDGMAEQFWGRVVAWEKAEGTSHFQQLTEAGVPLPDPATLGDDEVHEVLWGVIRALAERRAYLSCTDHMSDRELYAHLWSETLHEWMPELPAELGEGVWHYDMLGGCSTEDLQNRLRYYADEAERAEWHKSWPDDEIPAHVDPPYDRDRHLPQG